MTIVKAAFFTENGRKLADRLFARIDDIVAIYRKENESLDDFARDAFEKRFPIIFIGACGIAVRAIAPYVSDKMKDSPVIVIDDAGSFVIPILSGHMGGANELAKRIAKRINAVPVITTATDVNHRLAIDLFAKQNDLYIENREKIAKVSKKLLGGESITICVEDGIDLIDSGLWMLSFSDENSACASSNRDNNYLFASCIEGGDGEENSLSLSCDDKVKYYIMSDTTEFMAVNPDVVITREKYENATPLRLRPKNIVIGIGCKRGKSFDELKQFIETECKKAGIDIEKEIRAIATIDLKKDEIGLHMLAQYYRVKLLIFSAQQLSDADEIAADTEISESEFVRKITGVSNVCERAALIGAGAKSALLVKKVARDGMTFAAAKEKR